ncbi:hypothetical protein KA005_26725 [bacterium]|nr:hypothetical protein [bacterium]
MAENCSEAYSSLESLIAGTENKEHECREFLQYAKEALIKDTPIDFVYVEKERRSATGDSDYIISCKVLDETGVESVKAYIWELKAPQCYIFEKDTENRLRPTAELIQAENQLFHYYHENRGDEDFRNDFSVTHSDNVHFGGIIIGCRQRKVKGEYEHNKKIKLFEKALQIRKKYIYDPNMMRIMDWNFILDLLRPSQTLVPMYAQTAGSLATPLDSEQIIVSSSG